MKSRMFLPLLTYPDATTEASVRSAVTAARLLGGDLHALALEADIPSVSSALSRALLNLPQMIRDAEKLSAENGARLLETTQAQARSENLNLTTEVIRNQPPMLGEEAAGRARYHDMTLLPSPAADPGARMLAEAILFGSGRPVLLVPDEVPADGFARIAIAWDGSRVAARAVADARALLDRAEEVSVITVTDEKPFTEKDPGERLAESLRQAGLQAEFSAARAGGSPIAETLQRHAAGLGAGLLVMGGYGHSRLRDFVLGGATEGTLSDLQMPVMLSH